MSKIIDTSEPPKHKGFRLKLPLAAVLGVVIVLGAGIWYFSQQKTQLFTEKKSSADVVSDANDEATKLAATKSLTEASKYYDDQIAASKDTSEKQQLLMGKASVAFTAGNFDLALEAAKEADTVLSSAGTLDMIARSYEQKGDTANALEYYRKALAALKPNEVTNRAEVELKMKIEELSGGQ